ncbi:Csa1 family protein, partial [Staphylococcus aureus]|uniref:Csa1 family protein n=1 Tax=Staphylococcus aureus TaxID=1280 RepID=UPI0037DA1825
MKNTFPKTLHIYPINNLHHLYHKQPYPHTQFKKPHKPISTIYTHFPKTNKPPLLHNQPIILNFHTNTPTPNPYYFLHT